MWEGTMSILYLEKEWGTKPAWNKGSAYVGCEPDHKRCPTCGEQPLSAFWKEGRNTDGLASLCKACWVERYSDSEPVKHAKREWYRRSKLNITTLKYKADEAYIKYLRRILCKHGD